MSKDKLLSHLDPRREPFPTDPKAFIAHTLGIPLPELIFQDTRGQGIETPDSETPIAPTDSQQ